MDKLWQAKWIQDPRFHSLPPINLYGKEYGYKVDTPHRQDLQNRHMLVRKSFDLAEWPTDSACLDITADDYYKLYINGRFVAQGPAQNYPTYYYYNRLEVKDYLVQGRNAIAVHVYYQGLVNRAFNSGDYRQGLLAELYVDDRLEVVTDASWRYHDANEYLGGEPFGYLTQYPENIDARLQIQGWRERSYCDEEWPFAAEAESPDYSFVRQPTPVVSVYRMNPASALKVDSGRWLIDFGQEITGQFTMKAKGQPGTAIEIRCGEELEAAGDRVRDVLRCNCTYRETWTLSGREDELEFYDYKAFRYVEVRGNVNAVLPGSFAAIVRHYPFGDDSCTFHSDRPLFNRIFQICKNGVKYGTQEHFVDCPTREKGQYLGDNTIIGHAHMLLTGDVRQVEKALRQFALSAFICPGFMAVVPGSLMQEIADFSLQWPMQVMTYYRQSGDLAFLKEMLPVAEGILAYFARYDRGDGLLSNVKDKWNLVDWPEGLRDGYDFVLSRPVGDGCHNVINAFYYGCLAAVREMKTELGIPADADETRIRRVGMSFRRTFFRPETNLFSDAEGSGHHALHATVLPLLFGLTPDDAIAASVKLIREKRLECGVYMAYFLLKALAKANEYGLIFELLTSEDEHSWGNMLKEGATTCFEAWGKEQKWNTSLCHPWASAPIPVLIEDILGLVPNKPGWEEIRFTPHMPEEAGDFTFSMQVKTGSIQVKRQHGKIEITAPEHVKVITY